MKFSIRWFFLLPLLFSMQAAAQVYEINGAVTDSANQVELPVAAVVLMDEDSTFLGGTTTNLDGSFQLQTEPGQYILKFSFLGYSDKHVPVMINNSDVSLGKIGLKEDLHLLDLVEIVGEIPPAVQKGDTTQFNAGAFKTNPDASAEDLVRKMPGIQMQEGKVQAQGEEVKKVLVDGKPFFGDDPNATLKNIPAEMIDKIEVFDQESEQARFSGQSDGNTEKTINIVTKKEFMNGTFGRVYGGYGTDEKYQSGGVVNDFKGDRKFTIIGQSNNINQQNFSSEDLSGVSSGGGGRSGRGGGNSDFQVSQSGGITTTNAAGVNYTDVWGKKTEVTGSYFFNRRDNGSLTKLRRQYVGNNFGNEQVYEEQEDNRSLQASHRANLRLEHKFNENNRLLFRPTASWETSEGISLLSGETFQSSPLVSLTRNDFLTNLNAFNLSNDLLWRHRFTKKGRTFSINLGQAINRSKGKNSLSALNHFPLDGIVDSTEQQSFLDQFESSYSAKADFTEPLGEFTSLQLTYASSISLNGADKETFDLNPENNSFDLPDTLLSNISESRYFTNSAGAGISYSKDKLMLLARGNVQHATLETEEQFPYPFTLNRDFLSVLPFAMARYEFRKGKNIRVYYRANTSAPRISQLQEVVDNSNPIQLRTGNPSLKQSFGNSLHVGYRTSNTDKSTFFYASISGGATRNYIANSVYLAQTDTVIEDIALLRGTQLNKPVNLNGQYSFRFYSTYSFPLSFMKSNLGVNLRAGYVRTPGLVNEGINFSSSPSGGIGLSLSSNISENLDFSVSSTSGWSRAFNSANPQLNTRYFNQSSEASFYWNFWKSLLIRANANHQYYTGLSQGFNTSYLLLNMSVGTKLFKDRRGELNISVYDLLGQNQSISRSVTETYIQDREIQVLQRYFMLNFTYQFRKFAGA